MRRVFALLLIITALSILFSSIVFADPNQPIVHEVKTITESILTD